MKKILLCFMVVTAMALLYSCQQSNGGKCRKRSCRCSFPAGKDRIP